MLSDVGYNSTNRTSHVDQRVLNRILPNNPAMYGCVFKYQKKSLVKELSAL